MKKLDNKENEPPGIESNILKTVVEQLCNKNNNTSHFIQKEEEYHSLPSKDISVLRR